MIDALTEAVVSLQVMRSVFHSEADFQHALAWAIHKRNGPAWDIRIEWPFPFGGADQHLDILLRKGNDLIAVELKYKTAALHATVGPEDFALRNQGAQDTGRYDFIKDICRLEGFVRHRANRTAYAVFLTNDSLYWIHRSRNTVDMQFNVHDGAHLSGTMDWSGGPSGGTTKGRGSSLTLDGAYDLSWDDYSTVKGQGRTLFRIAIVKVGRQ